MALNLLLPGVLEVPEMCHQMEEGVVVEMCHQVEEGVVVEMCHQVEEGAVVEGDSGNDAWCTGLKSRPSPNQL